MWLSARVWVDARIVLGVIRVMVLVVYLRSLGSGNFRRRNVGAVITRANAKKASVSFRYCTRDKAENRSTNQQTYWLGSIEFTTLGVVPSQDHEP